MSAKVRTSVKTRRTTFLREERGSAAPLLAFALVTLIGASGLAFDSGRSYLIRSQLSQAVDAAALAGGRALDLDGGGDHESQIKKYFRANLPDGFMGTSIPDPTIKVSPNGSRIEVVASALVPTTLMQVMGINSVTVSARAVVSRSLKGLEVALVLDNSGSMSGEKLSDLKSATGSLLDILYGGEDVVEDLHISLVPFTARTNLQNQASLVEIEVASAGGDDDDLSVTTAPARLCFDLRAGDMQTDDTPPTEGPFELYSGSFNPASDPAGYNDNICPEAPLLSLTASRTVVDAAVNDMAAQGCTRYDVGTAWGWRALSPRWRGAWEDIDDSLPVDYDDDEIQKAVIIMTDGKNTPASCAEDLDSKEASEAAFAETCDAMKTQGVLVYTITFKLEDEATNTLFETCASGTDRYFKSPTGEQLEDAFANIAADLTNLRLSE